MTQITRITARVFSSQLGMAKSGWDAVCGRTCCTNFSSSNNASFYSKNLQVIAVSEKDVSQHMDYTEKPFPNDFLIWMFLQATLMVQLWLTLPEIRKPKSPQLRTKLISVEYTKCLKMDFLGKPSSPVKASSSVVETLKVTTKSFRDVVQLLPGLEACTMCQEVVSKKRFFDERRFGLLRNCDHVVCYGCVRKLCETSGDGKNLFETCGVALGPVNCPVCDIVSDKVAASSNWIVGAEKVEFFKEFEENFSSDSMISQMTEDFKYLDEFGNVWTRINL